MQDLDSLFNFGDRSVQLEVVQCSTDFCAHMCKFNVDWHQQEEACPSALFSCVQALLRACEAEQAALPSNLAADEKLLATPHLLSSRARLALEFRVEKKRILDKCIRRLRKKGAARES